MAPTALDPSHGHHDSFTLPAHGEVDQNAVHASAKRSPDGGLIKVENKETVYEEGGIRAKFTDRGAQVTSAFCQMQSEPGTDAVSEDASGKLKVVKTEKEYEFFTKTKVGKVG